MRQYLKNEVFKVSKWVELFISSNFPKKNFLIVNKIAIAKTTIRFCCGLVCSTIICLAMANIITSTNVSGVCLQSIFTNSIQMTRLNATPTNL